MRIAFDLGQKLARAGLVIVSGMAAGIDGQSHKAALTAGGKTIAVLGCGLDRIYPQQNRELYYDIAEKGLLLSEYPLGTKPDGFRFPARNRIIAGLAKGVVVVEAARKSGSLITAQIALDYGREVFAVPGQMDSFKSEGSHLLIKSGACLVVSADDILEELQLQKIAFATEKPISLDQKASTTKKSNHHFDNRIISDSFSDEKEIQTLPQDALDLLEILEKYPMMRDTVIEKSGLPAQRVSEICLILELDGLIELLPGDRVVKLKEI